tara:strand:- start:14832 stop:15818 length:987 start_codon:yes stop_codon:yes gene_type:complete
MKINPEFFLLDSEKYNFKDNIIFVSGNEETFIYKIQNIVLESIKKILNFDLEFVDLKNSKQNDLDSVLNSGSLFENYKIIQINNVGEKHLSMIQGLKPKNTTILINGEGIKSSSKIKKFFDSHKVYCSFSCYKITRNFQKKIIDRNISSGKINLSKDAYWFLLENISDKYLLFENEIEKLKNYTSEKISLLNIKKMLSNTVSTEFDDLFFRCALGNNKSIISYSQNAIRSSSDAYVFLQVVKNFNKIFLQTSEKKDEENERSLSKKYLPRYLFKQSESFELLIQKFNIEKIININKLLQKTELLLRKNDGNYLIILQRFLFNFKKFIK